MANLQFWYNAVNGFLKLVQPNTIDHLINRLQLASPNPPEFNILKDYPIFVHYGMGYLVCAAIGLLLFLFMPLIGCCLCCCRTCCNNCGGRVKEPKDTDKCRRVTYGVITLVLTFIAFFSIVCGFLANSALGTQTKHPGGSMEKISDSFTLMNYYKNDAIDQLEGGLFTPLNDTRDSVIAVLNAVPESASGALADKSNASQPLMSLLNFVNNMGNLSDGYVVINETKFKLISMGNQLNESLTTIVSNITRATGNCSTFIALETCERVKENAHNLTLGSDFEIPDRVQPAITALETANSSGLPTLVLDAVGEFNKISENIHNNSAKNLDQVRNQMNSLSDRVRENFKKISNPIKSTDLGKYGKIFMDNAELVKRIGDIRYLVIAGLTALIFIIVALNLFGVFFGGICKLPRDDDSTCCTSNRGADMLLAAVGLTFVFYWIWILITMSTFLLGGLARNEACRYLLNSPEVQNKIGEIDQIVGKLLNTNQTISLRNITRNCEEDKSLYTALNLQSFGINIDELLNLRQYGIDTELERIRNITIDIGDVGLLSPQMNITMIALGRGLEQVKMSTYYAELDKGILNLENTTKYITDLDTIGLKDEAEALRSQTADIENERKILKKNVDFVDTLVKSAPMSKLANDLKMSEFILNATGNSILKGIMNQTALALWNILNGVTRNISSNVREDIGRCRPAYVAVVQLIDVSCKGVVDSLNGIWFSHGACIILFLPTMIFTLKLVGLFRKRGNGHKVGHKDAIAMDVIT